MYKLHDHWKSVNGYKARLVLNQLNIPFRRIEYDVERGETRTLAFLAMNPNGRIPVLEFPEGGILAESNAILSYLADGTALLPDDRFARAQVLQWLFFEQNSHEPYISTLRYWMVQGGTWPPDRQAAVALMREKGHRALTVMEDHLAHWPFFVRGRYTIADIALYAGTHLAEEAGYSLQPYPSVRAWLDRVAGQPGHVHISWGLSQGRTDSPA